MKNNALFAIIVFSFFLFIFSCKKEEKTAFTPQAIAELVEDEQNNTQSIQAILNQHQGQKVLIDIWASWCGDCIKSLSKVAKMQEQYPDVAFVFISVDDDAAKWKGGIAKFMDKFDIRGEQYHLPNGWDKSGENEFLNFVDLDWIPRYMLLDEKGKILVYYAKSIEYDAIVDNL